MNEATRLLSRLDQGDPSAAGQLLPLIYDDLRQLAAAKLAAEKPGQTLQPTALVHEAFLRLVQNGASCKWNSRGHFFGAAAEAMRRILVERARAKSREKRGGGWRRWDVDKVNPAWEQEPEFVLAIDEGLEHLAQEDEQLATLVKLRCFAGFSLPEAARLLNIPKSTAYEHWAYAKSRLRQLLSS